jgi:hypothetical protein
MLPAFAKSFGGRGMLDAGGWGLDEKPIFITRRFTEKTRRFTEPCISVNLRVFSV